MSSPQVLLSFIYFLLAIKSLHATEKIILQL